MLLESPRTATDAEFAEFIALPENADRRFELIHGEIIEVPSNPYSSEIAALFIFFIRLFLRERGLGGHVTGEAGGYRVMGHQVAPDVAYLSSERQAALPYDQGYNPLAPDLVVEVVSPSDDMRLLRIKITNYLAAGVVVWVADVSAQQVEVHAPGQPVQIVGMDGALDGGAVLPGFSLPVREVFPPRKETTEPG